MKNALSAFGSAVAWAFWQTSSATADPKDLFAVNDYSVPEISTPIWCAARKFLTVGAIAMILSSCSGGASSSTPHASESVPKYSEIPSSEDSSEESLYSSSVPLSEDSSEESLYSSSVPVSESSSEESLYSSSVPLSEDSFKDSSSSAEETSGVELLSIEGGDVDAESYTAYLFVEHDIDVVSLSPIVQVSSGCAWSLFRGETEIRTKVAAGADGKLAPGYNTFYILVFNSDQSMKKAYSLTIYRSFEVTISYCFQKTLLDTDKAYTGIPFALRETQEITGYTFSHWIDESGNPIRSVVPWDNMTFEVVASANTYTVLLDPNGGEVEYTTMEVIYGTAYSLPIPTRNGYEFVSWKNGSETFPDSGVWKNASTVSLTAYWNPITYKIVYDLAGGTNNPANPSTYTICSDDIYLADPSRKGYEFIGWTDGTGAEITKISSGSSGNMNLTANWSAKVYTITYSVGKGAINPNPESYTIEDDPITLLDPTRNGYVFYGWYDEYGTRVSQIDTKSAKDIVLTAQWGSAGLIIQNGVLTGHVQGFNQENVIIPTGVTTIGSSAFYGCSSLASLTIPSSVTTIGYCAFYGCSSLASLTIPSGVTTIGDYAFYGCSSLASLTIPSSVTTIGSFAFYGCSSLLLIEVEDGNGKYDSRGGCNAIIETSTNTLILGCSATEIPSSVTTIGSGAFERCSSLVSLTIPSGVTTIGSFAFYGCSSLASLTISSSVTTIGSSAFERCSSLASLTIPSGVTTIGTCAFDGCSSLEKVFYEGTEWPGTIIYTGLSDEQIYIYSENKPEHVGRFRYWHYVDGVPTIW